MPATQEYRALLAQLGEEPYPRAVVGLWVLERVYLEAWRYAKSCGAAGPYAAAVAHWTEPSFANYVAALQDLVDNFAPFPSPCTGYIGCKVMKGVQGCLTSAGRPARRYTALGPGTDGAAEDIVGKVLRQEVAFRDMAEKGTS